MQYKRRVSLLTFYTIDKKIILQKRDMKAPSFPGYWGFFGGGIEENENPVETVKREIYEELKINIVNPILLNRYEMKQQGGVVEKYIYMLPLTETIENLKTQQTEGETLGLFEIKQIYSLKFPKVDWIVLKEIQKYFDNL